MLTPRKLICQMEETAADKLPERWREEARRLIGPSAAPDQARGGEEAAENICTLQEWLEEVYFDEDKISELSSEDIRTVGRLVKKMIRFEPSSRAPAHTMLEDPWFRPES